MYQEFSSIYDLMMSEIPYDKWFERLHKYIIGLGFQNGHVCELGCGTGEMTGRFCDAGYEMTGIDLSPDMLALAMDKKKKGQNILYLNQDMTHFSLHKPADVVLCICDTLNYLLDKDKLFSTFMCVRENLSEDGIFIFDMKTEYCYSGLMGNEIRVEDEEDYTVIWDNYYDGDTKLNEYQLTMFLRQETTGQYERYDECHVQKAYGRAETEELLVRAGFILQACFGADMEKEPDDRDERIYYVARQC